MVSTLFQRLIEASDLGHRLAETELAVTEFPPEIFDSLGRIRADLESEQKRLYEQARRLGVLERVSFNAGYWAEYKHTEDPKNEEDV